MGWESSSRLFKVKVNAVSTNIQAKSRGKIEYTVDSMSGNRGRLGVYSFLKYPNTHKSKKKKLTAL